MISGNMMTQTQIERRTLLATVLASSMAFIDSSALNVALDAIQKNFNVAGAQLVWVINAYLLMLAALILFSGSLGDHYGRKRIFQIGIVVFAGASVVCGVAPTIELLTAARVVQGIGGALMIPGSLAILSATYSPERRGQAIGLWSLFSTVTTVAGPVVGGALASAGLWRVIFLINIPLAIVSLIALRGVPESNNPEQASQPLDFPGAFFITAGLALFTFGAIELGRSGEQTGVSPQIALLCVISGVAAFILFLVIESRSKHPMLDLKLFRSRNFSGANLMTAFLYGALSGALLFLPLNLIQIQRYSETNAGVATLPVSILLAVMSPLMGRFLGRIGARLPMTLGTLIVGLAFFLFSLTGLTAGEADYWTTFFPGILCIGIGMGLVVTPLTTTVMSALPSEYSGTASGVNNAVTRSAQVLTIAVFSIIAINVFTASMNARTASLNLPNDARAALTIEAQKLGNAQPPQGLDGAAQTEVTQAIRLSFVEMFQQMMRVAAVFCVISAVVSALTIRNVKIDANPVAEGGL
jgi:EmrB/QacA subfamily drug resistance transporter